MAVEVKTPPKGRALSSSERRESDSRDLCAKVDIRSTAQTRDDENLPGCLERQCSERIGADAILSPSPSYIYQQSSTLHQQNTAMAGGSPADEVVEPCTQSEACNYGDALGKAILFFERQRSGKLPSSRRVKLRGDSAAYDGKPQNVKL